MERPNAKYNLSNLDDKNHLDKKENEEKLHFYYNRERRLENAPDSVKNLYKEQKKNQFSLLGPLLADKPRRMLFILIIVMCAGILVLSITGYFDTSYTLEGNRIDVTAAGFEGTTIVVLKKTAKNTGAYSGSVDIAVTPIVKSGEDQYPVFTHRVFFTYETEEIYRFVVPFDAEELVMLLQNEKNTLQMRFKP
ncbi:MAG: hypothetical protein FWD26_06790 [Treponema sp.]|nr:hypothetical protein [Treponema sp.]